MKEMIENLIRFYFLLTVGLPGGITICFLIIFGRLKISGYSLRKLIPLLEGLIVFCRHPSLWEPGLLPFLFWPFLLFIPKMVPYSTPDKKNYFDKWWFFPMKWFCIPIERENEKGRFRGLRKIIKAINAGKIVLVFPEGGRTDKGEEFKVLGQDGTITIKKKDELLPTDTVRIRRFQKGVSGILKLTKAPVLLIWTEGGENVISTLSKDAVPHGPYFLLPNLKEKTIFKIGERINDIRDAEVLEDILLKLSQKGKSAD